ncbi:MAG: polyprenyl synthetase family protein [Streptococcus sp.]|nr:polyprenyl synthetase family protein [Streptococcus sp.]
MKKSEKIEKICQTIEQFYRNNNISPELIEAILYSIHAGGKRIRPLLFLELLEGFGIPLEEAHFQVAAAIEMIHTGSLIHDDLPAMDNDDYRRGKLTNHKKFGEAMAILAGDSLFLDPYSLVARTNFSSNVTVLLMNELSQASGSFGMVAGQALDMKSEQCQLDLEELQMIHVNKTGKLIVYPFVAAALVVGVSEKIEDKLRRIGELLGLAFQIRDDILDVTASFEELGKTPKKDLLAEKSTYPALLGLDKSYLLLDDSLDKAQKLLVEISREMKFQPQAIQKVIESLRLNG